MAEFHRRKNNTRSLDMMNVKYDIWNDSGTARAQLNPKALGNAWFVNNIREVPDANQEITALNDFNPATTAIVDQRYRDQIKEFKGEARDSNASITIKEFTPDKVSYTFNSNTQQAVVFSEVYYNSGKGWQAYLDGEKVDHFRANYILRGMVIPAGKHEIVFAFEPQTYFRAARIQEAANIAVIIVLIVGLGFGAFRYFKPASN